ncbi:eukaryotic translation initiation factor 3 subunit B-like isoform X2 [Acyrthosiphon pisum]|uniref:Uncharacterized protein n=1 Tax=Acyrthosiphon pisum TaxID=7029 RepID=A0A8R2NP34_ACYPI|nr:eukaryotic translation initiation factor 3 subunit B-like isoform X2 [Acyrthosiphon pisum]
MAVADDAVDNKLLTSELTVDNKIDEVLLNLVLQKKLEVSTVIKVDGIPKTEPKTFDRLQRVITKIFTQFGKIPRVYYPKSEKGDTKGIATLLQPIPSYNEPHSSSTPTTYHQYHVNKSLYIRIQDWMNNVPHIPDLEKRKMIAEAQLAMVKNKVSKKC